MQNTNFTLGKTRRKLFHALSLIIGIAICCATFYILFNILKKQDPQELIRQVRLLPNNLVFLALAITICNFWILTGYDTLSMRYLQHPIPYSRIAFAAFVAYSLSHSLGFPLLTGSGVRFRLYSSWDVSTKEIGQLLLFNILTFWLGVLCLSASILLVSPESVIKPLFLPSTLVARALGTVLAVIIVAYLMWSAFSKKEIQISRSRIRPPGLKLALAQILVSSADWATVSLVAYLLVKIHLQASYPRFLVSYFLGQAFAAASHVPGGLGVFESVMILFAPDTDPTKLLASLVTFRIIYFIIPLIISSILFTAFQMIHRKEKETTS